MHPQYFTYIIQTMDKEFYCGKTIDMKRRFKEHKRENKPHWFGFGNRKTWSKILFVVGDYEKFIKRAGVEKTFYLMDHSGVHPE